MTAKIRSRGALIFICLVCLLTACERPTHVKIEDGTAPVFVLSGSGRLQNFAVWNEDGRWKSDGPFDDSFALWEIKPIAGDMYGRTPVEDLGSIAYGVVPSGYVQVKPLRGSPTSLAESQKYFYEVVTTNAPWAAGWFEIRNSLAIPTVGQGPCFGGEGKQWVRVPCPKMGPDY